MEVYGENPFKQYWTCISSVRYEHTFSIDQCKTKPCHMLQKKINGMANIPDDDRSLSFYTLLDAGFMNRLVDGKTRSFLDNLFLKATTIDNIQDSKRYYVRLDVDNDSVDEIVLYHDYIIKTKHRTYPGKKVYVFYPNNGTFNNTDNMRMVDIGAEYLTSENNHSTQYHPNYPPNSGYRTGSYYSGECGFRSHPIGHFFHDGRVYFAHLDSACFIRSRCEDDAVLGIFTIGQNGVEIVGGEMITRTDHSPKANDIRF